MVIDPVTQICRACEMLGLGSGPCTKERSCYLCGKGGTYPDIIYSPTMDVDVHLTCYQNTYGDDHI